MHAHIFIGESYGTHFWQTLQEKQSHKESVCAFGVLYQEDWKELTEKALEQLSPGITQTDRRVKKVRSDTISVQDIQTLQNTLTLTSDTMRTIMIWKPERMRTDAANKLLKTLEEPNKNITFLLYTEKQDNVLPTLLSRCLIHTLPAITDRDNAFGGDEYLRAIMEHTETLDQYDTLFTQFKETKNLFDRYILAGQWPTDPLSLQLFLRYTYEQNIAKLVAEGSPILVPFAHCLHDCQELLNLHGNKKFLLEQIVFQEAALQHKQDKNNG